MDRRDVFLLILLLVAVVVGVAGCCVWLAVNLVPFVRLLLLVFLAASG